MEIDRDDRFLENTFQSLQKLVLGSRGSGMSRWKGLSKPQLLQWDRLLDDLQGSFYWMIIDIVLYGREVSRQKFRIFGGCQTVYQWSNRKNDKRQRVLFFAPLPIGITFMTILLLEIISCGKGLSNRKNCYIIYKKRSQSSLIDYLTL